MSGTIQDLSAGEVSQADASDVSELLENEKQKRKFRAWLFWPFGVFSFVMFVGLFSELVRLLAYQNLVVWSSVQDWHTSLILIAILVIFASVPLSIVISLMRMSASRKSEKEDDAILTIPQIEVIKNIISLVSPSK